MGNERIDGCLKRYHENHCSQELLPKEAVQHPSLCQNMTTESLTTDVEAYAYLKKMGFEVSQSVAQYVVSVLTKFESKPMKASLIERLVCTDRSRWNALIKGCVHCREFRQALVLYHKMCELCLQPEKHTFIGLIKTCAEVKDVRSGCKLHSQAVVNGWLESDLFIGNSMVNMYGKCGQLAAAQDVFQRLPARDLVSWNALIAAFSEKRKSQAVLNCARQMHLEGILPDPMTFVCTLNACDCNNITTVGLEFHGEIVKKGIFEISNFVGNALISMYSRCNMLLEAQSIFDRLLTKDVVAWNALISGYAGQGCGKDALRCFDKMQLAEVSPNAVTFVCTLKACSVVEAMEAAQTLHAEICRKGLLTRNLYVGNAVIGFYSQIGLLTKAHEILDSLPVKNAVSWTSVIAGYANFGLGEEALECFTQMKLDGLSPNNATFICILKACASVGAIVKGIYMHADIARMGLLERHAFTNNSCRESQALSNAVIDMYSKCGFMERAQEVFDKSVGHDLILWTALIAGYSAHELGNKAIECLRQLRLEGFSPSAITYVCSLNACGCVAAADEGKRLHAVINARGLLQGEIFIGNALMHMYAKCGLLTNALHVFDNLPVHDVVSWTALISAYVEHKFAEEAFELLEKMQEDGFSPNPATYTCLLKACAATGSAGIGMNMHRELASKGFLEKSPLISNALVDMYVKCGSLMRAQEVFYQLSHRDVVAWTALIGGFVKKGESLDALHLFDAMSWEVQIPDLIAFINVLAACSRMGVVDMGQEYFDLMSTKYALQPTLEHYTCMADLLSRAGHLTKALGLVGNSPFNPDLVLIHEILNVCKQLGNEEIGRTAFEHVLVNGYIFQSQSRYADTQIFVFEV